MDCKTVHTDLIFYLDNELPEERLVIVRKHLEECADCRNFLHLLREEMQLIETEKNPEVSPFFFTRLSARLEEKPENQPHSILIQLVQPVFFSLILITAIYGGIHLGSYASSTPVDQPAVRTVQMMDDFEAEPIESFLLSEL